MERILHRFGSVRPFAPRQKLRPHRRRAACNEQSALTEAVAGVGRREAMVAVLLVASTPASARRAAAEEVTAEQPAQQQSSSSSAATEIAPVSVSVDPASWPSFIDFAFRFKYPPELLLIEDLTRFEQPRSTNQRGENPVKAELRSEDGSQRLTVVTRQASSVKQTLLQVTDITALGSQTEVARLIFPPGTRLLATSAQAFALPPRDTKTPMGVVQRQPITIYSYEAALPGGARMAAAVAAQLGRVFVCAGTAPEGDWPTVGPRLRAAAASFRIIPK